MPCQTGHEKYVVGSKCYFCHDTKLFKPIKLYDQCIVPSCGLCYVLITKGREVAKEKGLYDGRYDTIVNSSGGDSMKIEKGATGGNNLKVAFVQEKKLTKLKIIDEGEMVTYQPQNEGDKASTKLVLGVSYEGQSNGDPEKWSLNNKSRNALIDIWGDDTSSWVNKEVEIGVSGEGEYRHIVVDTLRTK